MTDEELLRLSLESETLAPEAGVQLHAELAKRGINSPALLEEFRMESSHAAPKATEYKRRSVFVAALRDWKRYRQQTGEWPVLSIIAALIQGVVLSGCGLFTVVFAVEHDWPKAKFLLVFVCLLVAELCVWDRIQKKIRLKELRSYRIKRTLSAAVRI